MKFVIFNPSLGSNITCNKKVLVENTKVVQCAETLAHTSIGMTEELGGYDGHIGRVSNILSEIRFR